MGQLNLTNEEINQLKTIHKYTYNDSMRENRIKVVLLYERDMSKTDIKKTLLLDLQTIRRYINDFINYRMDSIDFKDGRKERSGNKTDLNEQEITEIKQYLQDNIVSEAKEIQDYIETRFNVKYSLSGTTALLHRLNFSYKKVIAVPQKAHTTKSIEEQLLFEQDYQKLKENIKDNDKVYFLDGVHPTHNTKVGYAWIEKGKEKIIETNSGRNRVNINGAYDVFNNDVVVTSSKTINSDSTLELFDTMLEVNSETNGILYCICDNARYYKSKIIQEVLKKEEYQRIKMIFIPPYSPNLNPIEKVWKFFKKEVFENQFYKTFKEFTEAIDNFFQIDLKSRTMKRKLAKFATDNFHIRGRKRLSIICPPTEFKSNYFGR